MLNLLLTLPAAGKEINNSELHVTVINNKYKHMKTTYLFLVFFLIATFMGFSQEDAQKPESADAIAEKLNNPTAAIGSLTGLIDFKTFDGDLPMAGDQTAWSFTFQPSLPKPLKNGKNLLIRPAIPILLKQPIHNGITFENSGVQLGDIGFDLAIGSTSAKGILFLAGIVGSIPTALLNSSDMLPAFFPPINR